MLTRTVLVVLFGLAASSTALGQQPGDSDALRPASRVPAGGGEPVEPTRAGAEADAPRPAGGREATANKALVRRFYEQVYDRENLAVITELFATNFVAHLSADRTARGPAAIKQAVARLLAAFPDLVVTIEGQMAEGDQVITRWTLEGTHRGEWREIAPTGRRVRVMGITIFRLAGDRIVEGWETVDELGLLQQIVPDRLSDRRSRDGEPDRRTDHVSPNIGISIGYWVTRWRTGSSQGRRK